MLLQCLFEVFILKLTLQIVASAFRNKLLRVDNFIFCGNLRFFFKSSSFGSVEPLWLKSRLEYHRMVAWPYIPDQVCRLVGGGRIISQPTPGEFSFRVLFI